MQLPTMQHQVNIKNHNTFGMDVQVRQMSIITHKDDLAHINGNNEQLLPYFILGGGSNLLLLNDIDAWVLKNECKGITTLQEDEQHIWLQVGGGEVWHDFVMYCVENNYAGIENLALIPGTVGAAPIQNIGAYGVEVKEVIEEVHAYDLAHDQWLNFQHQDCEFGYRESVFKRKYKNKYFIYAVTFKLNKTASFRTNYGDIQKTLTALDLTPNIANIAKAVIHIRQSKLPDPKEIGNSGSFFKNPEIAAEQYQALQTQHPNIPGYHLENGLVKVPAGWLIEQAGWKGFKENNYGVHPKQALVLVNYGGAAGKDIYNLSERIIQDIFQKFGIMLEREVQVYP